MDADLIKMLAEILGRLDRLEEAQTYPQTWIDKPDEVEPIPPPVLVADLPEQPREQPVSELGQAFKARAATPSVAQSSPEVMWDVPPVQADTGREDPKKHHLTDDQIRAAYLRDQQAKVRPQPIEDELASRMA